MRQQHLEEEDDIPIQPPIPSRVGFTRDTMGGVEDSFSLEEEFPARYRRRPNFSMGKSIPTNNFRNSNNYGNFSTPMQEYEMPPNYNPHEYTHHSTGGNHMMAVHVPQENYNSDYLEYEYNSQGQTY